MQLQSALDQGLFGLFVTRIRQAALDGANGLASLVVVKSDALRAKLRIDDVDVVALRNCAVRALGLASAAIDAVVGNARGHDLPNVAQRADGRESALLFLRARAASGHILV